MMRFLPFVIELVMLVYCLVDCVQTAPSAVRRLPKPVWIVAIVVFPVIGGIAWLVLGRPRRGAAAVPGRATGTAGVPEYERPARSALDEVDERLRRDQERVDQEHDDAVRRWQATRRAAGEGGPEAGTG